MSIRFQNQEASSARSSTFGGVLCCMFICATIAFVAWLLFQNSESPRRLWSPIVVEANGNMTVLGDSRQLEFWTPSVQTKDYLAKPGGEVAPTDKWQVISNDDTILQFGTMLHSNKNVLGYRRIEVWGYGRTSFKPGWWWTLNVLTNYSAGDLGHAYEDFWKPHQAVFVEVIDNRGRDE